jgi:cytoskeletal protein CcmA (bactofilin family)
MISGLQFEGEYDDTETYQVGDGVAYGGIVYIAIADTTGNEPPNATYWSQFADGIQYEGTYSGATAYQPNDVVKYGAKAYIAKLATTGNLPTNATYWDMLVDGISAEGVYNSGTAYTPGDLVAYGANIYICTTASTGNLPTNASYFTEFISSVQSAGVWSSATTYYLGDLVTYGGNTYVALRETINDTPDTATSDWQVFLEGVNPRGAWTTSTTYYINDIVTRGGSTYRALVRHASGGSFATDLAATKWEKYNSGIRWRGEWAASTAYLIDDLVYNGVSTYIATADFTSDATDFDNDTYWDLLSLGADTLPAQLNNEGKFLSTNGTTAVWADSGTLESLTVGDGLEVNGDVLSHGDVEITSRTVNVVNKILTNNVVTLTTDENHYFDNGDVVVVAGVTDFNGTYTITGTPTDTTFTYAKVASNVGSTVVSGGTAEVTGNLSTEGTLDVDGAANVGGALAVTGDLSTDGDLYVGDGAAAAETSLALTDTIAVGVGDSDAFVQFSIHNQNAGNAASTDFIAYADNGDNDNGWVDMGITSSTFDDATYGITGPNDGYIFMSAPAPTAANVSNKALTNNVATLTTSAAHGFSNGDEVVIAGVDATFNGTFTVATTPTSTTFTYAKTAANVGSAVVSPVGTATRYTGEGNLVLATDATGSANKIVFAAGGLDSGNEQMSIVPDQNVHIEIATASTNATTGALTVVGGIGSNGDISINGTFRSEDPIFVGSGAEAFESSATLTDAMMVINKADNTATSSFSQIAFRNADSTSSTDIIAYMDNGNDANGWVGMGITGSLFDDATYGITNPGDGYIFHETRSNAYTGNLVLATGGTGSDNKIIFAAGGFASGLTQMEITPGVNVHIEINTPSTSPTTGALTVVGGVGIQGDLNIQGNVDIEGTIVFGGGGTTVETSNLAVTDPFVFIGSGNQADTVDLGFIVEHTVNVSAITATVTNKSLTNNVATLTTSAAHNYRVGDVVVVSGVDATFDGTYAITSVPTSTTFTYARTAANVASQADTGGTDVQKRRVYDGIVRDATDNVIKFFQNLVVKPTSTVDFAEAGITYADIKVDDIDADAITATGNLTIATNKLTVNASSGAVSINDALTVGGLATFNGGFSTSNTATFTGGAAFSGTTDVQELREQVVNPSIASNAATLDWSTGNIFYTDASGAGANITYNVTNVPTDVNKIMTINIFQVQGSTGRIPGTFQIGGVSQTIKWVGGSAPTPTSSSGKIDVFSFTMHRLAAGTWNVYGSSSLNF